MHHNEGKRKWGFSPNRIEEKKSPKSSTEEHACLDKEYQNNASDQCLSFVKLQSMVHHIKGPFFHTALSLNLFWVVRLRMVPVRLIKKTGVLFLKLRLCLVAMIQCKIDSEEQKKKTSCIHRHIQLLGLMLWEEIKV